MEASVPNGSVAEIRAKYKLYRRNLYEEYMAALARSRAGERAEVGAFKELRAEAARERARVRDRERYRAGDDR